MNKSKKRVLLVLELLLVMLLVAGVFLVQSMLKKQDAQVSGEEELSKRFVPTISYEGQSYPLKRNLSTVLLIGTDSFEEDYERIHEEGTYYNYNLGDLLIILVFDNANKTVTPFQICRDTMCDVYRVNTAGDPIPDKYMQVTLAHSYGSGKEDSCILTRKTIERLLLGIPIDHYMSFTMDTVPLVNDLVGGVTVTLTQDVPVLGERFVKGATITLKGMEALRFVRYRDTSIMDSNLRRMVNQRTYMEAFTATAREAAAKDPDLAVKIFKAANPFLVTDLSVENVQSMVEKLTTYEILPTVMPEGYYEHREGERFPGYYVDNATIWSCVKPVFCQ